MRIRKPTCILIVDDNMTFVERLVGLLEESGIGKNIDVASNYDEASRLFFRDEHAVIILDINMPGKNGVELLKFFQKSRKRPHVIMMTNHADAFYRQQCLELGAEYFLDKSNDFELIPDIIMGKFRGAGIKTDV